MKIATESADTINVNLIKVYDISKTRSFGTNGAIISSTPNASGNMKSENFENTLSIISHVNPFIVAAASICGASWREIVIWSETVDPNM
mmetsp:Transcript_4480/g.7952  ORF Transcript_4480/g.7952 Transcript_4480/m.7952 type:complete len:89 (-) Transcript_4480:1118-1384(-)